jgi:hypothetical protein
MLKTVGNPSLRYGDQTIIDGNLVIGTAGKGIDFSSDPSAPGMTSELLDDYEEGTWTPTIEGSGTAGTATYTLQIARYTKVGRLVYVYGIVGWNTGTGTGNLKIASLPFAAAEGACLNINFVNDLSYSSNTTVSLEAAGTALNFKETPIGQGATGVSTGSVAYDVAAIVQFSGCYSV